MKPTTTMLITIVLICAVAFTSCTAAQPTRTPSTDEAATPITQTKPTDEATSATQAKPTAGQPTSAPSTNQPRRTNPTSDAGKPDSPAQANAANPSSRATEQPLLRNTVTSSNNPRNPRQTQGQGMDKLFGRYQCEEEGQTRFTEPFFNPDSIKVIEPMGKTNPGSGHVTPTDHLYVHRYPPANLDADTEYVVAPADGKLVSIQRFPEDQRLVAGDSSQPLVPDLRAVLMHSCTLFTIFIHLGDLAPSITAVTGNIPLNGRWSSSSRDSQGIQLKAGQPIAKFGGDSLDWSVHDSNTTLKGFVIPEHYKAEPWKIHTVDPFPFYDQPVRTTLLGKALRTAEPPAGKIDYDIEGTIAGNWFLDGTVDYTGGQQWGEGTYWEGHLSIVYGYIDPTQVRLSIGFDTGIAHNACKICFGAFGVKANTPDPATVTTESGLIKYEIMDRADESTFNKDGVGETSLGTFLVQHLGERSIRVEIVVGKAPEDVAGFSEASQLYRR